MTSAATPSNRTKSAFLGQLRTGQVATVRDTNNMPEQADLLRAMGLRPHARISVSRTGSPYVVIIGKQGDCCRIGLPKEVADHVAVEVDGGIIAHRKQDLLTILAKFLQRRR